MVGALSEPTKPKEVNRLTKKANIDLTKLEVPKSEEDPEQKIVTILKEGFILNEDGED